MIKTKIIIFIALFCCVFFGGCATLNNNLDNVTLINNTFTYTGAEITPVFSGLPNNCKIKTYCNGVESKITNAGNYTVKVIKGKSVKEFVITVNKLEVDLLLSDITVTYGENYKIEPQVVSQISGEYSFVTTYNGNSELPTQSGIYEIEAILISDNYCGTAQSTLTINKTTCDLGLEQNEFTYSGEAINLNFLTSCTEDYEIISNNINIVNVGNYNITATLQSKNFFAIKTFNVTVNAKPILITLTQTTFTYTGNEIDILQYVTCDELINLKLEQEIKLINADTYNIKIIPTDNNYAGSLQATIVVQKKSIVLNFEKQTVTFDNIAKSYITDNLYQYKILYNNSPTLPVNAGTYKVHIEVEDNNLCGSCDTTLEISKKEVELTLASTLFTYTGNKIELEINESYNYSIEILKDNIKISDIVNVGEYKVIVTVDEYNYCGTFAYVVNVIAKEVNISLNTTQYSYTGNVVELDISFSENVSYVLSIYQNSVKVENVVDAGTYNIDIVINDNNYTGNLSASINVIIEDLQDKVNYALSKLLELQTITATGSAKISYGLKTAEMLITKTYTTYENGYSYYERYYSNYAYEESKVFFLYSQNDEVEYERSSDTNKTFSDNLTGSRETELSNLGLLPFTIIKNAMFDNSTGEVRYALSSTEKSLLSEFYSYVFNNVCVVCNAVITLEFNSNYEFSGINFELDYLYDEYEVIESILYAI